MATEGQSDRSSLFKNHIMLSLCVIAACLQTIVQAPGKEPVSQIFLLFNLATGYVLTMASIFAPGGAKMKGVAARLSVVLALISLIHVMAGELACKVQTCHSAMETQLLR